MNARTLRVGLGSRSRHLAARVGVLLLMVATLGAVPAALSPATAIGNGWVSPIASPTQNYAGWLASGCGSGNYIKDRIHLGLDIGATVGTAVLSIGPGKVVRVWRDSSWGVTNGVNNAGLWVQYTAVDGATFVAVYGHMQPGGGIGAGTTLSPGQVVGTVGISSYGAPSHLHLGVHPGTAIPSGGWGMTDCAGDQHGFTDPNAYLGAHPMPGATPQPPPPSYPAGVIGPGAAGFAFGGPSQYWRGTGGLGVLGQARWTNPGGAVESNTADWTPVLGDGVYDVAVFIPRAYATANTRYVVSDAAGSHEVVVNQSLYADVYVSLGRFADSAAAPIRVHLTDRGEAYSATRYIAADAARFTYVAPLAPTPTVPAKPQAPGADIYFSSSPGIVDVGILVIDPDMGGANLVRYDVEGYLDGTGASVDWLGACTNPGWDPSRWGLGPICRYQVPRSVIGGSGGGLAWGFRVRAVNTVGPGPWSDISFPVPVAAVAEAPTMHVFPGSCAYCYSERGLTVTWDMPTQYQGWDTGWVVRVASYAPGSATPAVTVRNYEPGVRSATFTGLPTTGTHVVSVRYSRFDMEISPDSTKSVRGITASLTSSGPRYAGEQVTLAGIATATKPAAGVGSYPDQPADTNWATLYRLAGSDWVSVSGIGTDSAGRYSFTIPMPARTTTFRVGVAGTERVDGTVLTGGSSPSVSVGVRPRVSITPAARKVKLHRKASFTGTVSPSLAGQRVVLQKRAKGRWVSVVSASLNGSGAYRVVRRMSSHTDYAWRIYAPGTSAHVSGASRSIVIKVP